MKVKKLLHSLLNKIEAKGVKFMLTYSVVTNADEQFFHIGIVAKHKGKSILFVRKSYLLEDFNNINDYYFYNFLLELVEQGVITYYNAHVSAYKDAAIHKPDKTAKDPLELNFPLL